jgi:hypothetical protein
VSGCATGPPSGGIGVTEGPEIRVEGAEPIVPEEWLDFFKLEKPPLCGNSVCEPNLEETALNCPGDCLTLERIVDVFKDAKVLKFFLWLLVILFLLLSIKNEEYGHIYHKITGKHLRRRSYFG